MLPSLPHWFILWGGNVLSEKSRNSIYQGLTPLVGEEATAEMLAHFPSTEAQQPVTREYLDLRLAELRSEIASVESGLRGDMAALESGLRGDMAALESGLRSEIAALRTELHQSINRLLVWLPMAMAAIGGVAVALSRTGG
jgi:hypothetical protein